MDLLNTTQQITSIHQDINCIAAATIQLVEEALANEPIRHIEVPIELIVRKSAAKKT